MHELSIAMSLVEAACEEAERLGDVQVDALHVRVGPLAGVVHHALRFSFDLAAEGTTIAGARLEIEETALVVFCARCDVERTLSDVQHFRCPVCHELTPHVVSGRELELAALEVTSHAAADR